MQNVMHKELTAYYYIIGRLQKQVYKIIVYEKYKNLSQKDKFYSLLNKLLVLSITIKIKTNKAQCFPVTNFSI